SLPTPDITMMDEQEGYTPFEQSSPEYGMEYEDQVNYMDPVSVEPHEYPFSFSDYENDSETEKEKPVILRESAEKIEVEVHPSSSGIDKNLQQDTEDVESLVEQPQEAIAVEEPQEPTSVEKSQERDGAREETPAPTSYGFSVFGAI
ncbi:16650_t:CDS:1, partial [Acaulospora colombiana]